MINMQKDSLAEPRQIGLNRKKTEYIKQNPKKMFKVPFKSIASQSQKDIKDQKNTSKTATIDRNNRNTVKINYRLLFFFALILYFFSCNLFQFILSLDCLFTLIYFEKIVRTSEVVGNYLMIVILTISTISILLILLYIRSNQNQSR